MTTEPCRSARRVFWIVDNGSDHRGKASIKRLQNRWRNLILVHLPVHASRLNQFDHHYNQIAKPFKGHFTRDDLIELLARIEPDAAEHAPAAIAA